MTFTDGKDVKAKVMGVDEDKDLAVLTVDPAKLGTEVRSLICNSERGVPFKPTSKLRQSMS